MLSRPHPAPAHQPRLTEAEFKLQNTTCDLRLKLSKYGGSDHCCGLGLTVSKHPCFFNVHYVVLNQWRQRKHAGVACCVLCSDSFASKSMTHRLALKTGKGPKPCDPSGLAEESKPSLTQKAWGSLRRVPGRPPRKESKTSLLETLRLKNDIVFDSGDSVLTLSGGGIGRDPSETHPETLFRLFEPGPGRVLTPLPGRRGSQPKPQH